MKINIGLVDDHALFSKSLALMVNSFTGFEVILTARNGKELQEKLSSRPTLPDIMLIDVEMPLMNGLEFLSELRADPELKDIHVCVLTTSEDDSDVKTAYEFNVAGYFIKPLNISDFDDRFLYLNGYWQRNCFPVQ